MEDLLNLGSEQYIAEGTYEVTMVLEYQGSVQLLYVCLIRILGFEPSESEGIFGFLMKNGLSEVPSEFSANDSFISKG